MTGSNLWQFRNGRIKFYPKKNYLPDSPLIPPPRGLQKFTADCKSSEIYNDANNVRVSSSRVDVPARFWRQNTAWSHKATKDYTPWDKRGQPWLLWGLKVQKCSERSSRTFPALKKFGIEVNRSVCETQSCKVGIRGGNGFLGTSGHRRVMNPSVMYLQRRLVLGLSVGLSFNQKQPPWRIDLFWRQLQALSALSCQSLARNLHSSGYAQSTCS